MENPEEVLHSLKEFAKLRPRNIPRELEDYLRFVARTGDPVYQWPVVKSLFREKLANVVAEFREACPGVEVPPCPNVDPFNYEGMRSFILERLDGFAAAPFTIQRICELLISPRKEYNRIDKYMRALEKNILVVSTTEPGMRRLAQENGEGIVNGLESEHLSEPANAGDINVEEMDDAPVVWVRISHNETQFPPQNTSNDFPTTSPSDSATENFLDKSAAEENTTQETTEATESIACREAEEPYVSIEPVAADTCLKDENVEENDVTVTITAIPAAVQKRRNSIEPSPCEENAEPLLEEWGEKPAYDESSSVPLPTSEQKTEEIPEEPPTVTSAEGKCEIDSTDHLEATQEPEVSSSDSEKSNEIETTAEANAVSEAAILTAAEEQESETDPERNQEQATASTDLKTNLLKSESESDSQSSSELSSSNENSLLEEPQPLVEDQVTSSAPEGAEDLASQSCMDESNDSESQEATNSEVS